MSHEDDLVRAAAVHRFARECLEQAEKVRIAAIRAARKEGRMTVRAIAERVELSHQRVSKMLDDSAEQNERATLHDEMAAVLAGGEWSATADVAAAINKRGRYQPRSGALVTTNDVRTRAASKTDLFEATSDGSGRIRLR